MQRYNKAMPRTASFIRAALYHVGAWPAPKRRKYGKAVSYATLALASGHSHASARLYVQRCYAAHKAGAPMPPAQLLALPAPQGGR